MCMPYVTWILFIHRRNLRFCWKTLAAIVQLFSVNAMFQGPKVRPLFTETARLGFCTTHRVRVRIRIRIRVRVKDRVEFRVRVSDSVYAVWCKNRGDPRKLQVRQSDCEMP